MKMLLHPLTAAGFWLTNAQSMSALGTCKATEMTRFAPTQKTIDYLRDSYPHIPWPFHVIVTQGRRNPTESFRFYQIPKQWSQQRFARIAPGIYTPSPEQTLASLGKHLSIHELIYLSSIFCSGFRFDPNSPFGISPRTPLTSIAKIRESLNSPSQPYGFRPLKQALSYITEGAESPPEVFMSMALSLPQKYGGSGIARSLANWTYMPSQRAQAIAGREVVRPDITFVCNGKMVAVEYDSDSAHLSRAQAERDEAKRLALEADGMKVISVRPGHLKREDYMDLVAQEICFHLDIRQSKRPECYSEQRDKLFQLDRSLSRFFLSAVTVENAEIGTLRTEAKAHHPYKSCNFAQ